MRQIAHTLVLVPGAGGSAWYWHRVVPLVRERGHTAIAVDLPGDDVDAGLPAYADLIVDAIGDRDDAVVVAQSLGAFSAVMACARRPVARLILLNAMIPLPGETPGEWWGNTGSEDARIRAAGARGYSAEFDLDTYFLHDVPPDVLVGAEAHYRDEAAIAFGEPCDIREWPAAPTAVVAGRDDRFFPLEFQRRVARDRLGARVDIVPGGHLAALAQPATLAERLIEHAAQG